MICAICTNPAECPDCTESGTLQLRIAWGGKKPRIWGQKCGECGGGVTGREKPRGRFPSTRPCQLPLPLSTALCSLAFQPPTPAKYPPSCASLFSRPFSGHYRRGHRPRSEAVRRVTSGLSFPKAREVHWREQSVSFQTGSSPDRPAGQCGGCLTCGPWQQAAPAPGTGLENEAQRPVHLVPGRHLTSCWAADIVFAVAALGFFVFVFNFIVFKFD